LLLKGSINQTVTSAKEAAAADKLAIWDNYMLTQIESIYDKNKLPRGKFGEFDDIGWRAN